MPLIHNRAVERRPAPPFATPLCQAGRSGRQEPTAGEREEAGQEEVALVRALVRRGRQAFADPQAGMTTAEYAVGTVAACGFGGILYKLLTSESVVKMLKDILERALTIAF